MAPVRGSDASIMHAKLLHIGGDRARDACLHAACSSFANMFSLGETGQAVSRAPRCAAHQCKSSSPPSAPCQPQPG